MSKGMVSGTSMDPNLRNFKDFISLYNKLTALCFGNCVDTLSGREITKQEADCVNSCVTKYAHFNQKIMSAYIEVQTAINQRRLDEMMMEQQQQQEKNNNKTNVQGNVLPANTNKLPSSTNINPL